MSAPTSLPALSALPPGATLGLIGGGQLGSLFIASAKRLGYPVVLLDPDPNCPAAKLAERHLCAAYDAPQALAELAELAQAITTEFENVPAASLQFLAERARVAPTAASVAIAQDRIMEKRFFSDLAEHTGVHPVPWAIIEAEGDIVQLPETMLPGVLKTARHGYDGKGQARVKNRKQLQDAWQEMGRPVCVLERWQPLAFEVSLVLARGADGQTECYPMAQNLHQNGILHTSTVPAPDADANLQQQAQQAALYWSSTLGYVGVLCFEFFVLRDGSLLVNEMAPRPHNSGHYTLDACQISQFEQQVRSLAQLPLQAPNCHAPAIMLNLLGDLWQDGPPALDALAELPDTFLHMYGKQHARNGRKMGHVTVLGNSLDEAQQRLALVNAKLAGAATES